MGRHAWLAAKRTPSIKPMMSSASVGIASANAGCPDRLCNNLRPAHRHLEHDTIVTVKKKNNAANQDCLPRTLDRLSSGKPHSWSKRDNTSIQKHWVITSDFDLGTYSSCPCRRQKHGCHDLTQLGQQTTIRSSGRNGGSLCKMINALQILCPYPLAVTVQVKDYSRLSRCAYSS